MDEKQRAWLDSKEGKAKHEHWKNSPLAKKARANGKKFSEYEKKHREKEATRNHKGFNIKRDKDGSGFTLGPIHKKLKGFEEETQLNEISRKLRQRYERANLKDQNRLKNAPEGGVDQERKIARKLKNRKQGYQDAVDRDTGYKSGPNEETLDEIKNKTLKSYMDKVNPPILSHSSRDSRKDKNRAKGFAGAYARVYKNNLPRHKDGAYWNDKYRKEETFDEASPIGKAKKYFQRGMKTQKQSAREKADGKLNLAVGLYNVQHKSIREPEYNQYGKEGRKAQRDYMRYKKFAEETLDEKKVCVKWQDKPEKKRTKDYKDWEKFMSKEEAMNEEKKESWKAGKKWEYEDATGVKRVGHFQDFTDRGGTDVTYHFRRADTGRLDLVSGSRLKKAKRIWGEEKDFELPTQYGGEYSVRKINELSKDTIEKAVDKHYKKGRNSSLGIMGLNRLKGEYLHAPNKGENPDGTVSKNMKFKPYHGWKKTKDKKGYKSTIQAYKEETEQLDELKNVAKEYIKKASVDATNKSWNAALGRGNPKTNVKRLKRIEGIANAADRLSGTYTKKVSRGKKGPVWVKHPYHAEEIEQIDELGDLVLQRYKDKVDQTNRTGKGTVGHLRATERQTGKFFVKNKNKLAGGEYKKYHGAGKDWKPSSTASHSNSSKIDRFRKGRPMDSHSNRSKMDRFRKGGPMDSHRKGANIREEEIDEAAKDRPFTKWAAKAIYGDKGSSNLKKGACVTCGSTDTTFKDALSKKEWGISGMCQNCQDKVFSK